jgi:hypothetical protein
MKPWEETWDYHGRVQVPGDGRAHGARLYSDNHEEEWATAWGEDSVARARLAAAAPEMARLLLSLQWVDTSDGEYRERCPVCQNRTRLPPDGRMGIPLQIHDDRHSDSCALVAVLRKAGVLD